MTNGDRLNNMIPLTNGDAPSRQHPTRPPLHSHHSNSVPSTPYQQPRDLRFHSRSPSPNRALGTQSPQSVLSDATGGLSAQRSTPVVCKFETGAEIRKRRIPYVEGGNEELGPPQKEPKKTLEPDEREKLSGDMRELYDRLLPSAESEDRRARLVLKLETMLNQEWPGHDIRVHVFGSSGNDLSSNDSDVDICITTNFKKLETMHAIAMLLHKNGMEKVVCRASAKVPIVKCWDPDLKLATDLNVNNTLALENTRMIKTYVHLDERVRPLAKIIKHWTKRRILNDAAFGGTISSYTWICMIINFLQRRAPPILPSLQKFASSEAPGSASQPIRFADNVEELKSFGNANKETLADLLYAFFREYGYEFEYSKYVVSIREGRLLSRKEKGWDPSNYQTKEARNRLCVEEPFTINRNLGNSADDYAWSGIHGEIRRACDLLADGAQLETCCEQYVFPPEEKPIFQRPTPKPKPTLTRSASQSGRPNNDAGSGRSRKSGNRNQSSQRAGNRRASSGAAFNNQRAAFPFQSPPGGPMPDYFSRDLHNTLYQQYQYLQAQQDALQRQLQQAAQAQAQSQGRSSEASGSPLSRAYSTGLPSPRFGEYPPSAGPLLPGYLYHYPARYPPPSPMSQARSREGSSTNPSSPSMSAAVPTYRRQAQRGTLPEGSSGSTRSQSQPGRSLPHPLTSQQHAHPGYDVSGALGHQNPHARIAAPVLASGPLGIYIPMSAHSAGYPPVQAVENAMPKEYVGYYVGQSPPLGPQFGSAHVQGSVVPPVPRSRRVTPDLGPPLINGRHNSRSPSPLGPSWTRSLVEDWQHAQPQVLQSPGQYDTPIVPAEGHYVADYSGPLIVDGSGVNVAHHTVSRSNGIRSEGVEATASEAGDEATKSQTLPVRPALDTSTVALEQTAPKQAVPASAPAASSGTKPPNGTKVAVNTGETMLLNGIQTPQQFPLDTAAAPLLSPVAELRTPSPTRSHAIERESPKTNGSVKVVKVAHSKPSIRSENVPLFGSAPVVKHERTNSAPKASTTVQQPVPAASALPPALPSLSSLNSSTINQNPWQQVPRKGHRKSKSSGAAKPGSAFSHGGQPLPADDADRKGG